MKKREIEQCIKRAVEQSVPDVLEQAAKAHVYPETVPVEQGSPKKRRSKLAMRLASAAAALVVLVGAAVFFTANQSAAAVDSIINIDINPSVELRTNRDDVVIEALAVNDDGNDILDGMDLTNVDLDVAVNAIMGSMFKKGYLGNDASETILVSVFNEDEQKAAQIKNEVVEGISGALSQEEQQAVILNQQVDSAPTAMEDAETLARQYHTSVGKIVFLQHLVQLDDSLVFEDLVGMTMQEIVQEIEARNIDISSIIEIERDDSLYENIEDAIDDVNEGDSLKDDDAAATSRPTATRTAAPQKTASDDDDRDDDDDSDDDNDDDRRPVATAKPAATRKPTATEKPAATQRPSDDDDDDDDRDDDGDDDDDGNDDSDDNDDDDDRDDDNDDDDNDDDDD